MIHHTFIFNNLPAHELVPYLVAQSKHWHNKQAKQNRANNSPQPWHVCWLNNDNNPVIGLLPRTSWIINPTQSDDLAAGQSNNAPALNIEIIKSCRQEPNQNFDCYVSSYSEWIQELIEYSDAHSNQGAELKETVSDIDSSQYHNGLMGFIGYDIGAKALSPSSDIELANQPAAFMGHYDIYLTHSPDGWQLHAQEDTPAQAIEEAKLFLQHIDSTLNETTQSFDSCTAATPPFVLDANWQFTDYAAAFEQTQQFLYQGDSYQINLTQKWSGKLHSADSQIHAYSKRKSLVSYLPMLHEQTKAPFAGYLAVNDISSYSNSGQGDDASKPLMFELLSCSPELFVVFSKDESGSQRILTKPIKGTLPRGTTPEQDEQLKQQLANSEKDRAENVMIVDLLRNDLGRYAKTGSVQVPHLFAIESFSNVHHMVSSITATIKDDIHPLTVLFDSLPAGSITGTPKKRAVEIISELESGPRGAYCGTLGFMNFDGLGGQWNVLIRSLQANQNGEVELWAGGGITVSSECAAEYQECKDKVGNLLRILNQTAKS